MTRPICGCSSPGVAALCAWAAWDSRLLRYPVLLLNVAMAVSAVTDASHYAVDVIAGLGVASVSVGAARAVFYRRSPAAPAMSPSLAPALAS
ncbi:MAG TPA: phosphatase PAP2 family protein [Hansschlegelia sp.]